MTRGRGSAKASRCVLDHLERQIRFNHPDHAESLSWKANFWEYRTAGDMPSGRSEDIAEICTNRAGIAAMYHLLEQ